MKFKKYLLIVLFFAGLTLFVFSLLPFFRGLTETFWIATVVGAAVIALCIFGLCYKPKDKDKVKLNSKYERKTALLTEPERRFLQTLRQIAPDEYEVLPQMALVNVIDKKTNASYRNELFRVCDYCFVNKKTFEPLLLVELNDSSHKRADRAVRDEKVAAICESARMPLVTFWLDEDLSLQRVKRIVAKAILK